MGSEPTAVVVGVTSTATAHQFAFEHVCMHEVELHAFVVPFVVCVDP